MQIKRSGADRRSRQNVLDVLSAIIAVAVVAVSVITFLDIDSRSFLLPVIFILAGVFECIMAVPGLFGEYGRSTGRKRASGIGNILAAMLLFVVAIVSGVCLWR